MTTQEEVKTEKSIMNEKLKEIRNFCIENSDPKIIKKYSRYFKDGFDGYGIESKTFEAQRDLWISGWKNEMSLEAYLELGDMLMQSGKFEEKSLAIAFIQSERENYTPATFDRIGDWFETGISNWATTDVLCMLVLSSFLIDEVISYEKLKKWTSSDLMWKRRAVPVTLVELIKDGLKPEIALPMVGPLMLDDSEYVQKGIGTLLRGLWKKYPSEIENFLLEWKDQCGRLIVQYATEKMDKEYRKRFKKVKQSVTTNLA
jgi:3-methyladenine DNA glycosylase AlkD